MSWFCFSAWAHLAYCCQRNPSKTALSRWSHFPKKASFQHPSHQQGTVQTLCTIQGCSTLISTHVPQTPFSSFSLQASFPPDSHLIHHYPNMRPALPKPFFPPSSLSGVSSQSFSLGVETCLPFDGRLSRPCPWSLLQPSKPLFNIKTLIKKKTLFNILYLNIFLLRNVYLVTLLKYHFHSRNVWRV